ncbi:MAG: L-seryl-tRNA(Sec) selenium transferase, partial [Candidatus Eisenbacteria bacterium]|nr:L-seryl-tRNA(Sec) selenium transferase [Candidatus Eisenbacteria bacterium]
YADPERARRELPTLAMLGASRATLDERAARLAAELCARVPGLETRVVAGFGEVGGGSLPLQKLPGPVVEVQHPTLEGGALEGLARLADPPVIGIVRAGHFRLDPRTLAEAEVATAAMALARVWKPGGADRDNEKPIAAGPSSS